MEDAFLVVVIGVSLLAIVGAVIALASSGGSVGPHRARRDRAGPRGDAGRGRRRAARAARGPQRAARRPRRAADRRRGGALTHGSAKCRFRRMARLRRFDLDELATRPGTYFNPETEILIVVDDSAHPGAELADADEDARVDPRRRRGPARRRCSATSCWSASRCGPPGPASATRSTTTRSSRRRRSSSRTRTRTTTSAQRTRGRARAALAAGVWPAAPPRGGLAANREKSRVGSPRCERRRASADWAPMSSPRSTTAVLDPGRLSLHLPRLPRIATYLCGVARATGEDLVQDTLERVLRSPRRIHGEEYPYLTRALRNTHVDRARAASRQLPDRRGWSPRPFETQRPAGEWTGSRARARGARGPGRRRRAARRLPRRGRRRRRPGRLLPGGRGAARRAGRHGDEPPGTAGAAGVVEAVEGTARAWPDLPRAAEPPASASGRCSRDDVELAEDVVRWPSTVRAVTNSVWAIRGW